MQQPIIAVLLVHALTIAGFCPLDFVPWILSCPDRVAVRQQLHVQLV